MIESLESEGRSAEMHQLQNQLNIDQEQLTIGAHIVIQDSNTTYLNENLTTQDIKDANAEAEETKAENNRIQYETFESSSEDEFSVGAFESAAHSFTNKEKNPDCNLSGVQEHKRIERQRRKERKHMEKMKQKAE